MDAKHALVEVTVPFEAPLPSSATEATGSSCHHPVPNSVKYARARWAGVVIADEHQRVAIRRRQRLIVVTGKTSLAATVRTGDHDGRFVCAGSQVSGNALPAEGRRRRAGKDRHSRIRTMKGDLATGGSHRSRPYPQRTQRDQHRYERNEHEAFLGHRLDLLFY